MRSVVIFAVVAAALSGCAITANDKERCSFECEDCKKVVFDCKTQKSERERYGPPSNNIQVGVQ